MDQTLRLAADAEGMRTAVALLARGDLVALPTETVYGLAADAGNPRAVAAIFEAKGRPLFNPLIVHCADARMAATFARMPAAAECLADAFWPGPLTLVLARREDARLADLVTAGLDTVALRVPAHPVAAEILHRLGRPVAAPSANPSGRVSPTTADHVLDGLSGRIAAVVDAGPCAVGVESTIVGFAAGEPTLLRPGGLPAEAIEAVLDRPLADPSDEDITAPGQLRSHYAPGARLRLAASAPRRGEGWLGFGPLPDGVTGPALTLTRTGDLREAAANLFGHLRALDRKVGPDGAIAVAPVPETGLGRAINDRLHRAAAPRD